MMKRRRRRHGVIPENERLEVDSMNEGEGSDVWRVEEVGKC